MSWGELSSPDVEPRTLCFVGWWWRTNTVDNWICCSYLWYVNTYSTHSYRIEQNIDWTIVNIDTIGHSSTEGKGVVQYIHTCNRLTSLNLSPPSLPPFPLRWKLSRMKTGDWRSSLGTVTLWDWASAMTTSRWPKTSWSCWRRGTRPLETSSSPSTRGRHSWRRYSDYVIIMWQEGALP